jgi:cytochrome c biogenesis protein CcdA
MAKQYGTTTIGLFILGFIFYFVNLCTAPLSFTVLPTLTAPGNLYLLAVFGAGVLTPFLAVGVVAGGSPALAKRIREQHRVKIRAFSGIILLAYSTWLITFNLMPSGASQAFSMGFFFSFPQSIDVLDRIVMAIFILVFSVSSSVNFKDGLGKSVVFTLGTIGGVVLLAASIMITEVSFYLALFANLQTIIIVTAAIMIALGLALLGIVPIPTSPRPFIQRLTRKNCSTLLWLFFLGFLLFFAAVRVFPLSRFITEGTTVDFRLILAFCAGLSIPFIVAGIISGLAPKLAKNLQEKNRLKMRALSGLILIAYAIWLLSPIM